MPNLSVWLPISLVTLPTTWNCFSSWSSGQLQRLTPRPDPNSNAPAVAVAVDEAAGRPEVNVVVEVQAGNPGVGGRRGAEVERQHVDLVPEEAEPEVGEQRRRERVVDAVGQALVARRRRRRPG